MASVLTILESAKRSKNLLWSGIGHSIVETDEMAAAMPFKAFAGLNISYMREGAAPDTAFIPDDGTMGAASSGTDDMVSVPARAIAGDVDVNSLAFDISKGEDMARSVISKAKSTFNLVTGKIINGGNTTSHTLGSVAGPFAAIGTTGVGGISYGPWLDSGRYGPGEIKYTNAGALWAFRAPGDPDFGDPVAAATDGVYVLRSFNRNKRIAVTIDVSDALADGRTWITFASSSNEFDGLNRLCASSMVVPSVAADGDNFSFEVLDELLDMVKVRHNLAYVLNGRLARRFKTLQRALGGANPEHIQLPGLGGPSLAYGGRPVLINDHIASTEAKGTSSTLSSVYLMSLDADEGVCMGVPSPTQSLEIDHDPRISPVLGFKIEELGERESVATKRTRVKWYGALVLRSELALARATEIKTVA